MFGFKCFYLFVMSCFYHASQTSGGAADNKGPR
jgi:hypothetical protein